jgi:ATP synthase regulation protein NCA2
MMNALHAMDEVMSSNDINMNLAAITPVALLGYVSHRVFRFFYYAFLQLGQSREQTYASIRNIVTDIERLLVMRNDPPLPNGPDVGGWSSRQPCVINSDDLGMLMLLIHEVRSILIRDRRRFSADIIRSVWEDLAELAGERGKRVFVFHLPFFSDRSVFWYVLLQAPSVSNNNSVSSIACAEHIRS